MAEYAWGLVVAFEIATMGVGVSYSGETLIQLREPTYLVIKPWF